MNTSTIRIWWGQRAAREKAILSAGGALLLAALLWWLAISPALQTLRTFDTKRLAQESQLQSMLRMQQQAQALQAQPRLSTAASAQALQAAVQKAFGTKADLSVNAGTATITLRGVSAEALAQYLGAARMEARSAPLQARLTRTANSWSGTLQMGLPAS